MNSFTLNTPVVLIIFNRPETTKQVFEEIRRAKPKKLFVIADGPRKQRKGEDQKCKETRAIINKVDWECEVHKNYSNENLGCKVRVASGLDWVFEQVEEAIILEDDCVPHPSFFQFCQELLEKYRYDDRIVLISGDSFHSGKQRTNDSYYFSRYNHVWGWASWKRAWKNFDIDMKHWPSIRDGNWLFDILQNRELTKYWYRKFEETYFGKIDSWAYIWLFAGWLNNQLSILPNQNLITNIGFGDNATHTKNDTAITNLPLEEVNFPLSHPNFVIRDARTDQLQDSICYNISYDDYSDTQITEYYKTLWLDTLILHGKGITQYLNKDIENVCIFGAGKLGEYLYKDLSMGNVKTIAYLDNNSKLCDTLINRIPVYTPEWLIVNKEKINAVIISIEGSHDKEIIKQLDALMGDENLPIISWKSMVREYLRCSS
jgi:hypothetical protein